MTQPTTPSQSDNIIDVAIIGGGVSGAYTAYRLMTVDPKESLVLEQLLKESGEDKLDVRLFEMSDRIGGRLWSIDLEQEGLPRAELGGMSFSRLQCNVYGLCKELGLKMEPSTLYAGEYLQYFNEKHYWASDYVPPTSKRSSDYYPDVVPFDIAKQDEKWKYPGDLLGMVFDSIDDFKSIVRLANDALANIKVECKNEDCRNGEDCEACEDNYLNQMFPLVNDVISFLRQAKSQGKNIYDLEFDKTIAKVLDPGGYNLIKAAADLHSIRGNWNLYDHCLLAMRSQLFRKQYYTLKKGYQTLPIKLVNRFEKQEGVVKNKSQLIGLRSLDDNRIQLTLQENGRRVERYARYVVLALPQHALSPFFGPGSIFSDQSDLLNKVSAIPAYKLMLVYKKKNDGKFWWEEIAQPTGEPIKTGFSLTEQHLQACYYIGGNTYGLVVASMGDTKENEEYWAESASNSRLIPGSKVQYLIDSPLVTNAQEQLKKLHSISDICPPVAALFCDWTDAPFGGGWHLWNAGVESWKVAKKIRQPEPDLNVFVCGEAYSEQQGWVEGAINSAEMVLQEHFGFDNENLRPSWVPKQYKFDV